MEQTDVNKLRRGDVVIARCHLDAEGANVRPGTIGVVFEETNAYGDGNGPMVRWLNLGACNIYNGDAEPLASIPAIQNKK